MFDGDYNFLLAASVDDLFIKADGTETTFGNLFQSDSEKSLGKGDFDNILVQLIAERPLSQIAIPHLDGNTIEEYDGDVEDLDIAYVPDNPTENGIRLVHPDGTESMLSVTTLPSNFTIVVSQNERLIYIPHDKLSSYNIAGSKTDDECEIGTFYEGADGDFYLVSSWFQRINCRIICEIRDQRPTTVVHVAVPVLAEQIILELIIFIVSS